mmetsp:Transcript_3141/g.4184  ORF Transcript_3141/g.4184 Transcript_3141/m.4184 type:complete len:324 (-) Transcript_3141:517-1488(-)
MTFKSKRGFSNLFGRRQRKIKGKLDQGRSWDNLLSDTEDNERYDITRMSRRSSASERHLNTDGSSEEQLRRVFNELEKEGICASSFKNNFLEAKENSESNGTGKTKEQSGRTLKSDGSSGRELQLILEKLLIQENKRKAVIVQEDATREKKLGNSYNSRTPPLEPISRFSNSPCSLRSQDENAAPHVQNSKFRFVMEDPNEQTKLYLTSRKARRGGKKKKKKRSASNQNRNILVDCDLSGLEVRQNSDVSMSSCSIDTVLDDSSSSRPPYRENQFLAISCKPFQIADDLKNTLVDTYGVASQWVMGKCVSSMDYDEELENLKI